MIFTLLFSFIYIYYERTQAVNIITVLNIVTAETHTRTDFWVRKCAAGENSPPWHPPQRKGEPQQVIDFWWRYHCRPAATRLTTKKWGFLTWMSFKSFVVFFLFFFSPVGHASSPAENWLRITEEGHKKTDQNRQHWNDKLKSLFCDSQLDTPFVCFVIFAWERETWTRAHAQLTQSVMQLKNFNLPDQT